MFVIIIIIIIQKHVGADQNPTNQLIHFIFIPLIMWSVFLFAAHCPLYPLPASVTTLRNGPRLTWAAAMLVVYVTYVLVVVVSFNSKVS